ncbi:hypothetical protein LCGC14_2770710, partial [marine sediment metagenome]
VQYAHKANWVMAIEIDSKAVEWAKKVWPLPNVEWVKQDICDVQVQPLFDTILCIEVLEHTGDPERAMANLRALLRPGGTAWISVPRGQTRNELHKFAWTEETLEADLREHFSHVKIDHKWPTLFLAECSNNA